MKVLSPDEMRLMDENCIHLYKIPASILMENAASSALWMIRKEYSDRPVLIICGTGNNGGDGLALGRKLYSLGESVRLLFFGNPEKLSYAADLNLKAIQKLNIPLHLNPEIDHVSGLIKEDHLIVDALFGTGLNRTVTGLYKDLIDRINNFRGPVLSLDIPSGINGLTAEPMGTAVKADMTISFGAPKIGNVQSPGHIYNGRLICSRISFPPDLYRDKKYRTELNLPSPLVNRDPLGYKNSFGKILVIAGGGTYRGAPALAVRAAFRSGAGYVTAALPESQLPFFSIHSPEAVGFGLKETDESTSSDINFEALLDQAEQHDVVLLGPGMTGNPSTRSLIRKLIPGISVPLILDADGLNALAGEPQLCRNRKALTILTPHLGEQKRLMAGQPEEKSIEELYNAVCIYKGPRSRIGFPDGRVYINPTGNEALGTAGSGDVLAGMISALTASQETEEQGIRKAVLLHGLSSELYSGARESFSAGDIIEGLPRCLQEYRKNYDEWNRSCYGKLEMIP